MIVEKIIYGKIYNKIDQYLRQNNFGARAKRCTIDCLSIYRMVVDEARDMREKVGALLLDCNKAFDSIDRMILYKRLRDIGIDKSIINLIISMHTWSYADIRIKGT